MSLTPEMEASIEAYAARTKRYTDACRKVLATNLAAIFDALARTGADIVYVGFDGGGDSGQIESIELGRSRARTAVPSATITWQIVRFEDLAIHETTQTLVGALETATYDIIDAAGHGGWENNEGGHGEVAFHVAARRATLDMNVRVIETEFSSHEFGG